MFVLSNSGTSLRKRDSVRVVSRAWAERSNSSIVRAMGAKSGVRGAANVSPS